MATSNSASAAQAVGAPPQTMEEALALADEEAHQHRSANIHAPDERYSAILKLKKKRRGIPPNLLAAESKPVAYSGITHSLDGVFGFSASNKSHKIDISSMVRVQDYMLHRQSPRRVCHDEFNGPKGTAAGISDKTMVDHAASMKRLFGTLRKKVYCRFSNLRAAFRLVDLDHSGSIARDEFHDFFHQLCLSEADADMFFDTLDPDENDEVSYKVFNRE